MRTPAPLRNALTYLTPMAVKVACAYLVFGVIWILLSDGLVASNVADAALERSIQTWKGWGFVLASALLLFVLLRREVQKQEQLTKVINKSGRYYQGIIENAMDLVTVVNEEVKVLYQSPSSLTLLGYEHGWLVGRDAFEFIHKDDIPRMAKVLQEVVATPGASRIVTCRLLTAFGEWRTMESIGKRLPTSEDGLARVVVTSRDVTERIAIEDDLRQSNGNLERAMERLRTAQQQMISQERLNALAQMASGIAHDFNNRLTGILGFTEILLMRPELQEDPQKLTEYLGRIRTHAMDGAAVIDRLRFFYGQAEDADTQTDLAQVAAETIELTRPKWQDEAQMRGITVKINKQLEPVPAVPGNESEWREILTNLMFNAVDAIGAQGTITISTHSSAGTVTIEVEDTGAGMSESVRLHCLEPFYTTKGAQGTGLGLAMAYGTVERFGGSIEVWSAPGTGTRISLKVPAAPGQGNAAGHASLAASADVAMSPLHVLVVDDQPFVQTVLRGYLENLGHTSEVADGGTRAMELFEKGRFDAVLTDQGMPDFSGAQLSTYLKAVDPDIPIILVTGSEGDLGIADHAGAVDLTLRKPLTQMELAEALRTVTRPAVVAR